ncbi:TPA: 30S ribosomal protein S3 [Candidatus Geothermarchaeota archaeon]|nr:30S ribosomal protein S3 [Candidatus Geothermarchaeota archaeon]HIQ12910.1 30S ribosomal protein S3 [Thermoprotei archaeon]
MAEEKRVSGVKAIISSNKKKILLDEWLSNELVNAGYSRMAVSSTPKEALGTKIIIYAARPSLVIGRRGSRVRELAKKIEELFGYQNVNITVLDIDVPELDPRIMAWQIERQLVRGVRYRRVGFWAINVIKNAGATAAEIIISGKLRTVRAAYQKFKYGDILKSGELADRLVDSAHRPVLTKFGIIGVKVSIMKTSLREYLASKQEEGGGQNEEGAGA